MIYSGVVSRGVGEGGYETCDELDSLQVHYHSMVSTQHVCKTQNTCPSQFYCIAVPNALEEGDLSEEHRGIFIHQRNGRQITDKKQMV